MFDKLQQIEKTYLNIQKDLFNPKISSDTKKSIELSKKLSSLEEAYQLIVRYNTVNAKIKESKEILSSEKDEDMLELAKEQLSE